MRPKLGKKKGTSEDDILGMVSCRDQTLDSLDFFGLQTKIEDVEIGPHVVGVGGAGQRDHADVEGKAEDNLADGSGRGVWRSGPVRDGPDASRLAVSRENPW